MKESNKIKYYENLDNAIQPGRFSQQRELKLLHLIARAPHAFLQIERHVPQLLLWPRGEIQQQKPPCCINKKQATQEEELHLKQDGIKQQQFHEESKLYLDQRKCPA